MNRFAMRISVAPALLAFAMVTAALGRGQSLQPGAVFTMTNAANENEVIAFSRGVDGTLSEQGRFATGGRGSGGTIDPLHSQGSPVLSGDHAVLYAVNAGSGDISLFQVNDAELERLQVTPSGSTSPVAIAVRAGVVYVLNAGPNPNVVTFRPYGGWLTRSNCAVC